MGQEASGGAWELPALRQGRAGLQGWALVHMPRGLGAVLRAAAGGLPFLLRDLQVSFPCSSESFFDLKTRPIAGAVTLMHICLEHSRVPPASPRRCPGNSQPELQTSPRVVA